MIDYFFISSPLHFFIAAALAIQQPDNERVAVVISRNRTMGARFRKAAQAVPGIFNRVLDLSDSRGAGGRLGSVNRRRLKEEFSSDRPSRLFTGNDRRFEFQFAMHSATRSGGRIEGIYMDEGAVTYLGHKSLARIQHRYVDPVFRKLFYGWWYKNALTTGASAWISTAYVAFPDAVHPCLASKRIVAIDPAPFRSPPFKALACALLEGHAGYAQRLRDIRLVLTLPHEGHYVQRPEMYDDISRQLRGLFPPAQLAVKPHPRIGRPELLERMFPGATVLDPSIGMEILLPLLPDVCTIAGDISSTLLTTRWLRPDLPVLAIVVDHRFPPGMEELYRRLEIPMAAPHELQSFLAPRVTAGAMTELRT